MIGLSSLFNFKNKIWNTIFISFLTISLLFGTDGNFRKYFFNLIGHSIKTNLPKKKDCPVLQENINKLIGNKSKGWSVSVLDEDRNLIAGINSNEPFIPASNIKLLSTAFALDKLGTDFKLSTELIERRDGNLEFWGQGDPDLTAADLLTLSKKVSVILKSRSKDKEYPYIIVYEEPKSNWWPDTWNPLDRLESYGSPITRMAIASNSHQESLQRPRDHFTDLVRSQIESFGVKPNIYNKEYISKSFLLSGRKVISQIDSAPMISLLSLANSESHNFTAEVLMKHAAGTWRNTDASNKLYKWLVVNSIPVNGFVLVDGSGLSRNNRATTLGIASLLWHMDHHRLASFYKSSLAIAGMRGTLMNFETNSKVYGNFYGKTGTLSGVRAISGILNTVERIRYISIINNHGYLQDSIITRIINVVNKYSQCFN